MFLSHRKPVNWTIIWVGTTALTQLTLCIARFFVYLKRIKGGRGNSIPKSLNPEKIWSWNLRQWCSFTRKKWSVRSLIWLNDQCMFCRPKFDFWWRQPKWKMNWLLNFSYREVSFIKFSASYHIYNFKNI